MEDGALDPVWRDYVVQKLPAVHGRPELGAELRAAVRAKLWALARGAEAERIAGAPTVDGTALLALFRLSASPADEVDRAAVGREGLRMAADGGRHPGSRAAGLQVAAHCGGAAAAGAADLARRWLREEAVGTPVVLKTSALATLGLAGDPADAELIEGYRKGELRLRLAAEAAGKGK